MTSLDPLDLTAQDESGGRNILQTAYDANDPNAINPSTGTHTAPSTASGPWQITNTTWGQIAPQVGVDTKQYPTAMSAPVEVQRQVAQKLFATSGYAPWALWNPKLARDVGAGTPTVGATLASAGLMNPVTAGTTAGAASAQLSPQSQPIAAPSPASASIGLSPLLAFGLVPKFKFQPVEYDPWQVAKNEQSSGAPGEAPQIPAGQIPKVTGKVPVQAPVVEPSQAQGAGVPYMTFIGRQSAWAANPEY